MRGTHRQLGHADIHVCGDVVWLSFHVPIRDEDASQGALEWHVQPERLLHRPILCFYAAGAAVPNYFLDSGILDGCIATTGESCYLLLYNFFHQSCAGPSLSWWCNSKPNWKLGLARGLKVMPDVCGDSWHRICCAVWMVPGQLGSDCPGRADIAERWLAHWCCDAQVRDSTDNSHHRHPVIHAC